MMVGGGFFRTGRGRGDKGQSAVEFALILPVLLLLVFGITEFGRLFIANLTLENAAREGARLGITGASYDEVTTKIVESSAGLDAGSLTVEFDPPVASDRQRGGAFTVTVRYPFAVLVPVIADLIGGNIVLSSSSSMRME